jgi:hypothetical protein
MGNEDLPSIYSLTLDIAYKKGSRIINRDAWAISRYDTPNEIMANDSKTMDRLKLEFYGKTYKGQKHLIIKGVRSKKVVGKVNRTAL